MNDSNNLRQLYRDLADGYASRGQPQFRDRFLVLAADTALSEGDGDAAERFRQRLLGFNPHHLLKPYSSFTQAMQIADVQTYVQDLRKNYPPDVARGLLRSLQEVREREANPQIPVTAPLINFGSEPDLLMDDDSEPLNILSLREDSPSGVPPTLPPEKFARANREPTRDRPVPQTLYEAAPAPMLPPKPAPPLRPRVNPTAALPRPVARPAAPPRPARVPQPAPQPEPPPPESEMESTGAWFSMFLFLVGLIAALWLTGYVLIYPLILKR
jgi:hypothetical protein